MAVNYNPKIITDGIILYFDANNPKSFTNTNTWSSLLGSYSINCNSNLVGGYLRQSNVTTNILQLPSLNTYSNLSFVVSIQANSSSQGTCFSVYGNTLYYFYNSSSIITIPSANGRSNSTSNLSMNLTYSNTGITTIPSANGRSNTTSNVNMTLSYSSSTITTIPSANGRSNSTSNLLMNLTYSNTGITTIPSANGSFTSLGQEKCYDFPNYDISAYVDGLSINTRFLNNGYDVKTSGAMNPSNNDVFVAVFKRSSSDSSSKLYINKTLISQSSAVANLNSFGNNFSILSRNAEVDVINYPFRSIIVYNKELSVEEINIITSAIRKNY